MDINYYDIIWILNAIYNNETLFIVSHVLFWKSPTRPILKIMILITVYTDTGTVAITEVPQYV